jgi:hypothetical protein
MTMTIDDPWVVTTAHECGHVAGYIHFGHRFGSVRVHKNDDGKVTGAVTSPAGNYNVIERAIICLGGPVAESFVTGVPIEQQTSSRTDILMACNSLTRLKIGPPLTLESLVPFTRLLIEHQWPHIERLATHLIIYHELDYEAVVRLLR